MFCHVHTNETAEVLSSAGRSAHLTYIVTAQQKPAAALTRSGKRYRYVFPNSLILQLSCPSLSPPFRLRTGLVMVDVSIRLCNPNTDAMGTRKSVSNGCPAYTNLRDCIWTPRPRRSRFACTDEYRRVLDSHRLACHMIGVL